MLICKGFGPNPSRRAGIAVAKPSIVLDIHAFPLCVPKVKDKQCETTNETKQIN